MLESQLDSLTVLLPLSSSNNSAVFLYLAGRPTTSGEAGHKGAGLKPRHPNERAPGATFYILPHLVLNILTEVKKVKHNSYINNNSLLSSPMNSVKIVSRVNCSVRHRRGSVNVVQL